MILPLIKSMRPAQWIKNVFVFAGIVFARRLTDGSSVLKVLATFGIFVLVSSAVYIYNDIKDREDDRAHPAKRLRPIASGELSLPFAYIFATLFGTVGVCLSFLLDRGVAVVVLIYLLINILYSVYLRRVVILDILCVASGFVLRTFAGTVVIDVEISSWLLVSVTLLSLFIVLGKRRSEIVKQGISRRTASLYTADFLDDAILVILSATLVVYMLYVFSARTEAQFGHMRMAATIPFVLYGFFRYLFLVKREGEGESPERLLLTDKPFLLNILLWGLTVIVVVYLAQ
ncbi:decaprenyl-phosphate phosphoribosyltransferase [bacterium]|nr:decaprenyl-phosphate phosphoribosyltransferase [bacterium]